MARIYIVDDEALIRMGLTVLAEEYGRFDEVASFEEGGAALEAIRKAVPDVVLTDIRMPRVDGLALCEELYRMRLNVKVIVLSGYSDFAYAQRCVSYGVKEYMLKPITEIELYPVLDRVLNEPAQMPFSISSFEQWLGELEGAVWNVDEQSATLLLEEGRILYFADHEPQPVLRQRSRDAYELLLERIRGREGFKLKVQAERDRSYDSFSDQIHLWIKELKHHRGGNQISALEAAMSYIEQHLYDDLSLEQVADRMGVSVSYFSHYFKKMTGETFVGYKQRKRIERAKELLAIPHYKVIDVVTEVGYDNYPHFSRSFKKMTGLSPTDYRLSLGIKS